MPDTAPPRIFIGPTGTIEQYRAGKRATPRLSGDYTIGVVLSGQGQASVAEQPFAVVAGGLILLNPHQSYQFVSSQGRMEVLLLSLATHYLYETAGKLQMDNRGQIVFRTTHLAAPARVQYLAETLHEELQRAQAGQGLVIEAIVSQLTVYLLRYLMDVRRSPHLELSRVGMVDRRLRRAIEYMHLHLAEELSLSEIAAAAFLSAYHFARLFKRLTGLTPHHYLAHLRLERARQLLATTDLSINDIAARVGYESQSHFAKLFRASTGLTPKQFQAAARRL